MKFSTIKILIVAAVFGLSAGAVIVLFGQDGDDLVRRGQAFNPVTAAIPGTAHAQILEDGTIADVTERSIDSVVNISSTRPVKNPRANNPLFNDPFFRRFFGPDGGEQPSERKATSLGSGVIVSDDGVILTNNHVVEDAEDVKVMLHDEREFDADILGTDPETDLAVIKLKGDVRNVTPISIGDSDRLRLGEVVIAIGNPFGLSHTVTMGIVSAKGRSFTSNLHIANYQDFIQTDAAINPGNSGGALINLKGELVGINTAIASRSGGNQGIGFAIPTNMARAIMDKLIEDGKIVRGWLGVGIQDVDYDLAEALELPSADGVLVTSVMEDSPAEQAGFHSQDVILSIDGTVMKNVNELRNHVAMLGPGRTVAVTVFRDGRRKTLTVKLGARPGNEELASMGGSGSGGGGSSETLDGFTVAPLGEAVRNQFNIPDDITGGVVVIEVEPSGPAADSGLNPGDVILEANKQKIGSVSDFTREYGKKDSILLYVYRGGNRFFAVLKKE